MVREKNLNNENNPCESQAIWQKHVLKCFCLALILLFSIQGFSNNVKGKIQDSKTLESIPFASVLVKNTTNGIMSDSDGNFNLKIKKFPCTIIIKFIGYKSQEIRVENENQYLNVMLEEDVITLNEITVKPDKSYELSLLRKVIKNRKKNNPDNYQPLSYKDYTRTTVFLSNLGMKTTQSKTFRKSADAFVKSSDSTLMMPFYMDETISEHARKDKVNNSHITAQKSDGILSQINPQIKTILHKKVTTEFNFYNNQIDILTRGFPSPISSTALMYYNIYLSDSIVNNKVKHYKFNFFPKSYKNITFKGHFWVEEGSWALTEIKASLPNSANLNFVKDLEVHINYEKLSDEQWFYKTQKINLKLTITKKEGKKRKKKTFDVQKLIFYRDASNNDLAPITEKPLSSYALLNTEASNNKIIAFRHKVAPLDTFEQSAYTGIKQLKENKFIKVVDKFSAMTLNGYYNLGKFDLGPYFAFYRKNEIEGNRFSLPLRTSKKMWKNFMLGGMLGYGFKNKDISWSANVAYQFNTNKHTTLKGHFHDDYYDLTRNKFINFIKENPYQQGTGNVFSAFTTTVPNPYVLRNKQFKLTVEHQLNKSIGLLVSPSYNRYFANQNLHFTNNGVAQSHFDTQNLMLDARFSFSQEFDEGFFSRIYYGNDKPVFHATALLGKYSLPNAQSNSRGLYAHLNFSMKNRFSFGPAFMRVLVEGGGIIGNVPYPLLMLPRGTRDWGSARYYFNLLHHTSYASDLYVSTHLALNGGGTVFNKIPIIKHLNLREIVAFKAFYGKLLGDHNKILSMPNHLRKPHKTPYMELSFGVANIFKCLRVDYVRRLNSGTVFDEFSSKNGVRIRLEVSF